MYDYRAISLSGETKEGVWGNGNKMELNEYLKKQGYYLISMKKRRFNLDKLELELSGIMGKKDLYLISEKLNTLLKSGISLTESIELLVSSENKKNSYYLRQVLGGLEDGRSLSESFIRTGVFPGVFINMVIAGEYSGKLGFVFGKASEYYKTQYELEKELKSNLTYPLLLLILSLGVSGFLLVNIIPSFKNLFEYMDGNLPGSTRMMINFSEFLIDKYPLILIAVAIFIGIFFLVRKDRLFRILTDKLILKLPIIGNIVIKSYLRSLADTLAILIGAGIPLYTSIEICADNTGNYLLNEETNKILDDLEMGVDISVSLENKKYFTALFKGMVRTGGRSGDLESVFVNIGDYYKKDINNAIQLSIGFIEPVMLIIISIFIGFIMISIMTPMFEIGEYIL